MNNPFTKGQEAFFDDNEIIVSKTDLKGKLTYCNDVFLRIAEYTESECLGQPHSMIRHPDMPRAVFALLWETIQSGKEIFAYVINSTKSGGYYWVLAHVTPSRDSSGEIVGYHSNRRTPDRDILENKIKPLYTQLLEIERAESNRKVGMQKSVAALQQVLNDQDLEYDEFIATL